MHVNIGDRDADWEEYPEGTPPIGRQQEMGAYWEGDAPVGVNQEFGDYADAAHGFAANLFTNAQSLWNPIAQVARAVQSGASGGASSPGSASAGQSSWVDVAKSAMRQAGGRQPSSSNAYAQQAWVAKQLADAAKVVSNLAQMVQAQQAALQQQQDQYTVLAQHAQDQDSSLQQQGAQLQQAASTVQQLASQNQQLQQAFTQLNAAAIKMQQDLSMQVQALNDRTRLMAGARIDNTPSAQSPYYAPTRMLPNASTSPLPPEMQEQSDDASGPVDPRFSPGDSGDDNVVNNEVNGWDPEDDDHEDVW